MKKLLLVVAGVLCLADSVFAGSVDIVSATVNTNDISVVYNTAGDHLRIIDSTVCVTNGGLTVSDVAEDSGQPLFRHKVFRSVFTNADVTVSQNIDFNQKSAAGHTNLVEMVGSVFTATNATRIMNLGTWAPNATWKERILLHATNTTFRLAGLRVRGALEALFEDCSFHYTTGVSSDAGFGAGSGSQAPVLTFKDCFITNWTTVLGRNAQTKPSRVILDGGTARFHKLNMSANKGSDAEVVLKGGVDAKVVATDAEMEAGQYVCDLADYRHFRMDVTDGATFTARGDRTSPIIRLGVDEAARCEIHVSSGGVFNAGHATDTSGFIVYAGFKNRSETYIEDGGELSAYQFKMGVVTPSGLMQTQTVYQSGGILRTFSGNPSHNNSKYSIVRMCEADKHDCRYYMTGGVLQTQALTAQKSTCAGGSGYALLSVDGGTIRYGYNDTTYNLIQNLDRVEAGPDGLTVEAHLSKGCRMKQEVTNKLDGNGDPMRGLFRKIGAYDLTVTLPGLYDWDVAETRVEDGTLMFTDEAVTLKTTLVVTNGAALSLVDGRTNVLSVDAFTVDHGTIRLDPGDKIVVPAATLNLKGLSIEYSATGAAGDEYALFETTGGPISDETKRVLRRAYLASDIAAGTHGTVHIDYDESTGKTRVYVSITKDADPLTDETAWQGAASDGWATDANWSDAAPDAAKVAVFSSDSAAKTVNVPAEAAVGALAFRTDGYELAPAENGVLVIASDQGAAKIETTAGTNVVSAPLRFDSFTAVTNGLGSKLSISGAIDGAGYEKTGRGELELSCSNTFYNPLVLAGGRTRILCPESLGADPDEKRVFLRDGTLTFEAEDGEEMRIENPITVSTPGQRNAAIVECRTDVTFADYRTSERGAFIKRGAGRLALEVRDGQNLIGATVRTKAGYRPGTRFVLNEDGSVPNGEALAEDSHYYLGINVLEGELLLKPAAEVEGVPKVTLGNDSIVVGLATSSGTVTPRLVLDGVDLSGTGSYSSFFTPGWILTAANGITPFSAKPEVVLLNGARLYAGELYGQTYGYGDNQSRLWAITNSTLQAKSTFWLSWNNVEAKNQKQTGYVRFQTKGASILHDTGAFQIDGGIQADFDNTFFGKSDRTGYAALKVAQPSYSSSGTFGVMAFRNGSVFRVNTLDFATKWDPRALDWSTFTLAFDDAEWQYGEGDYTLAASCVAEAHRPRFFVEMRGKGVKLAPPAGTTFTTELPFTGDGGLIVDGPGTVKFGANTLKFTGAACVRQGTLDAGGQAVSIKLQPGGTVPTLKDCAPTGKIQVDIGGADYEKGATFAVARISGSTPFRFKAVNFADPELYGYFTVQDGLVTMTVGDKPGLAIIVR